MPPARFMRPCSRLPAQAFTSNQPVNCPTEPSGEAGGKTWESRRCPLSEGTHSLTGDKPFGIIAYGYGSAGSYAFAGGADVKKIYMPPK